MRLEDERIQQAIDDYKSGQKKVIAQAEVILGLAEAIRKNKVKIAEKNILLENHGTEKERVIALISTGDAVVAELMEINKSISEVESELNILSEIIGPQKVAWEEARKKERMLSNEAEDLKQSVFRTIYNILIEKNQETLRENVFEILAALRLSGQPFRIDEDELIKLLVPRSGPAHLEAFIPHSPSGCGDKIA